MRDLKHVNTSYREDSRQLDFYGTVNADGTPHITLLTSMHLFGKDTFVWGEYSAGLSKQNQQERNKVGFMSVINGETVFFGKAVWDGSKKSGEEIELLNRIPQFRYNNVYGYSPAHILKLKELSGEQPLDTAGISTAKEKMWKLVKDVPVGNAPGAASPVTMDFFARERATKVIGFIDSGGFPRIAPLDDAVLVEGGRVAFLTEPYADIIGGIECGAPIAVFVLTYKEMGAVVVNGRMKREMVNGAQMGILDIERVYNPMLPVIGYVYPPELAQFKKLTEFEDTLYEYNV